jgi:hypothetical protein
MSGVPAVQQGHNIISTFIRLRYQIDDISDPDHKIFRLNVR